MRREVFKQTRSYNEGKLQQLAKYQLEHTRAKDEGDQRAICSAVRMSFAEYDTTQLSAEQRSFVRLCMTGR